MDVGVESNRFVDLVTAAVAEEGSPLSDLDRALVVVGLASSVTSLNPEAVREAIGAAYSAGASPEQIQEVVSVMSGLGVHSLMVSAANILAEGRSAGRELTETLTPAEQEAWDRRVGSDPFWQSMEAEMPGFLRSMLKLSPIQFEAFFDYCAVPWRTRTVPARTKELLAMASDALPTHVFLPGFRLHLANAVKLGAGRAALLECLELARTAPEHTGA